MTYEVNEVKMDVKYEEKLSENIRHDDHVIMIVDDIKEQQYSEKDPTKTQPTGLAQLGREVSLVEADKFLNSKYHTTTHEFLHMLGVEHPYPHNMALNKQDGTIMGYGNSESFVFPPSQRAKLYQDLVFSYLFNTTDEYSGANMREFGQYVKSVNRQGKTILTKKNTKVYNQSAYKKSKEFLTDNAEYDENKVK